VLVLVLLLAGVVSACGEPRASRPAEGPTAPGFPVTITHKFGTTTIPAPPKRIVALSFEEDALSLVGLATVGRADNAFASGQPYPWQVGRVDLWHSTPVVDANGVVAYEKIAALRPDLILATNFYGLEEAYPTLSRIAPTIGYQTGLGKSSWREIATVIGKAVGREPEMNRAVADLDRYLAEYARQMPGLKGKTFAGGYYYAPGSMVVGTDPNGQSARLLAQLGMAMSPKVATGAFNATWSVERFGDLDVDFLSVSFARPELRAELTANPLFADLRDVREGRVFEGDRFTGAAGNNPTMLNIPWLRDQWRPVLERVAAMPG
jgi:iron-siderophore transport system substrate-binding protein